MMKQTITIEDLQNYEKATGEIKEIYDHYPQYIGESDIAKLMLVSENEICYLTYYEDKTYYAHMALEHTIIPGRYELFGTFKNEVKIYSILNTEGETSDIVTFKAPVINIYRCGEYGVTIQLLSE